MSMKVHGDHIPKGFFEKFQLEYLPETCNEPDSSIQPISLGQSPSFNSQQNAEDMTDTSLSCCQQEASESGNQKIHWVVNSNILCPIISRSNEVPYRLLGSMDIDSGEVQKLMELETSETEDALTEEEGISPNRTNGSLCRLLGSRDFDPSEEQKLVELETSQMEECIAEQDEFSPNLICSSEDTPSMTLEGSYDSDAFTKRILSDQLPEACINGKEGKKIKRKPCKDEGPNTTLLLPGLFSTKDIRITAVETLYHALLKRVTATVDLDVQREMVKLIVENIELELFALYQSTDHRYKTKYRSILFNLKDPTNKLFCFQWPLVTIGRCVHRSLVQVWRLVAAYYYELFRKVVLGEITPQYLVLMTPEKMARQELTNWRNQKRQHTLDIIEREERTPHQIQITKLTHKGLIEVDTELNENWSLEDLSDSIWQAQVAQCTEAARKKDTTYEHKSHLLDPDCRICTGKMVPLDEASLSQWIPQENTKSDITLESSTIHTDVLDFLLHAEEGEKNTDGESPETLTAEESQSIWKGFIHMYSIKQFKVLAFLVSGYSSHLCQDLPNTITSKGCVSPESVWEYVDRIWPTCTKDMCLIRFCPRSSRDAIAYSRLFTYLSRKLKYGIIRSHNMEAFVVPLPANQPIPNRLRPMGGPGLDDKHPYLLLALLLPKHPSWTACPRRIVKKQKKMVDIPDDFLTEILADLEREELQNKEEELHSGCFPTCEQGTHNFESKGDEANIPQLLNILHLLTNNLQHMIPSPGELPDIGPSPNQLNPMPMIPQYHTCSCSATGTNVYGIMPESNFPTHPRFHF